MDRNRLLELAIEELERQGAAILIEIEAIHPEFFGANIKLLLPRPEQEQRQKPKKGL